MAKIEMEDTEGFTFEMEWSTPLPEFSAEASRMRQALVSLYGQVPLASFDFAPIGGNVWLYRWIAKDGREWREHIVLDPGVRASADFQQITGFWLIEDGGMPAEFAPHRVLREACVRLARTTMLTKIEATWP